MLLLATADQNRLLSALPALERDHLAHYLEPVVLRSGDILCEAGTVPTHLYFPTSAVLSILLLSGIWTRVSPKALAAFQAG